MALKFTNKLKSIDFSKASEAISNASSSLSTMFKKSTDSESVTDELPQEGNEQDKKLADSTHELRDKVAQFIANNSDKLRQWYSDNELDEKIKKSVKKAGAVVIYPVMMLYNLMKSPNTTVKDKMIIVAPLAYFILPTDLIPDIFVGIGYADDGIAIMASLRALASSITPEIQEQTKQQYIKIVGDDDTTVIDNISKAVQENQDSIIDSIAEHAKESKKKK